MKLYSCFLRAVQIVGRQGSCRDVLAGFNELQALIGGRFIGGPQGHYSLEHR